MREDAIRPAVDKCRTTSDMRMTRGRRTNTFDADRRGALVRHLYFQLGKKEREIASELGISCSTVNYYKNRQKR
jgi:hypothetical protein